MHRENWRRLMIITLGLMFISTAITWKFEDAMYRKEMARLEEENLELTVSLNQAENDVYELAMDLQRTNETLAETAERLANAQADLLEYEYIGEFTITAYCCEKYPHICGGGNTASGVAPTPYLTCAVTDLKRYPFGTILYIEGVGIRVVQDTGGFHSSKIDVAVKTHDEAVKWKTGKHKVWIVKEKQ